MKTAFLALLFLVPVSALGSDKPALPLPSSGNVTLPVSEYDRLLDLAAKPPRRPEAPPLAYTIQHAEMQLRVGKGSALGTMQLEGEVFNKGLTKVPMALDMTVFSASQQNKALPLQQEGRTAMAILPGSSPFSVALNVGLPLSVEAGRASFKLPVPAAGSVRVSLVLPGDHANVRINPGLITGVKSANGQTTVEAALSPGEPATVSWTTREIVAPQAPKEVRFLSEIKTLVSINESEIRAGILADLSIIQGQPSEFSALIPAGYEVTDASGTSVESSDVENGVLKIKLTEGASRRHRLFISMEKPIGETKTDAPLVNFKNSQRETGEILIEGTGAMELTAKESGGLKRLDLKEVNADLRSLSRFPLQAAFRYHREPGETPGLAMEWVRFPDSPVPAAIAERAIVTTLVTSEGRSLTEVKLLLQNQSQPFLKVELPAGVNILSADVAGEKVKPVQGTDGSRVPLLRPGFRPAGAYSVSFVFMHSGNPFARKGGSELALPKMDVPINLLQWEVFLPDQYKIKDFGGNALSASLLSPALRDALNDVEDAEFGRLGTLAKLSADPEPKPADVLSLQQLTNIPVGLRSGQLGGIIVDPTGAAIPGATVSVSEKDGTEYSAISNSLGEWLISDIPTGKLKVSVAMPGFQTSTHEFRYDAKKPVKIGDRLGVSAASETVEVNGKVDDHRTFDRLEREAKKTEATQQNAASANVLNLQRRVAGVLPVRVDVPRAGASYRFVRPLVVNEETQVTFTYKSK